MRISEFLFDLHQFVGRRLGTRRGGILRSAPGIENRNLVHARHRAVGSAGFLGEIFAAEIVAGIGCEWDARISALLRAVVDESVFADVEITSTGPATPVVGLAF